VLDTLARRLTRKHILKHFVADDHPVLLAEKKMVFESAALVRAHIEKAVQAGHSYIPIRIDIFDMLVQAIRSRIRLHDVDSACEDEACMFAEAEAAIIVTLELQMSN
jgi:hypothetical protein